MPDNRTLQEALRLYRAWGLHFLPALPNEKRPAVQWEQFQSQPPTREMYRDWWERYWQKGAGVLLLCGQGSGNFFALDFDSDLAWAQWQRHREDTGNEIDFYDFPVVKTARGWHLWGRTTHPVKTGRFAFGEIHGNGSLIMAPPSLHPCGAIYRSANPGVELRTIDDLASLGVVPAVEKRRPVDSSDPSWVTEALRGTSEGERNDTATRLAGYFHGKGLTRGVVVQLISDFAARCRPPLPLAEVERIVSSVERYPQPGGGAHPRAVVNDWVRGQQ